MLTNNLDQKLRLAAANGASDEVEQLLKNQININSTSSNGNTALHWTALHGNPDHPKHIKKGDYNKVIELLLANNPDLIKTNNAGQRAFELSKITRIKERLVKMPETIPKLHGEPHVVTGMQKITSVFGTVCQNFNSKLEELINGKQTIQVLDLACGLTSAIIPLTEFGITHNRKVIYTGTDINVKIINSCREAYKDFSNTSFLSADATNILQLKRDIAEHSVDLIILRHPDFGSRFETFVDIMLETIPFFLKLNGLVLITCYHAPELQIASGMLKLFGVQNITNYQFDPLKPYPVQIREDDKAIDPDSHALIVQLPNLKPHLNSSQVKLFFGNMGQTLNYSTTNETRNFGVK